MSACISGNIDCLQVILSYMESLHHQVKFPLELEQDWSGNKALHYAHILHPDRACVEHCSSCPQFTWGSPEEVQGTKATGMNDVITR
jgi:hypothetical protein